MASSPTLEDRQIACQRPPGPPVMYQSWTDLAFLHWEVDPGAVAATLPEGLQVDTFDGKAYIGLVPFYMRNIRLRGLPRIPGTVNFLEMNVRTYVYDESGNPGVWFYSLDANNPLACAVAQRRFHLPYVPAQMSAEREGNWIHYHCAPKRGAAGHESRISYRGSGRDVAGPPGSLEYFLAERYLLFAHHTKKNRLYSGAVAHSPYRLEPAKINECQTGAVTWCGFEIDARPPDLAHYSPGVDVEVFALNSA